MLKLEVNIQQPVSGFQWHNSIDGVGRKKSKTGDMFEHDLVKLPM